MRRMLPKNDLREVRMKRLVVYSSKNPPPETMMANVTKIYSKPQQ